MKHEEGPCSCYVHMVNMKKGGESSHTERCVPYAAALTGSCLPSAENTAQTGSGFFDLDPL